MLSNNASEYRKNRIQRRANNRNHFCVLKHHYAQEWTLQWVSICFDIWNGNKRIILTTFLRVFWNFFLLSFCFYWGLHNDENLANVPTSCFKWTHKTTIKGIWRQSKVSQMLYVLKLKVKWMSSELKAETRCKHHKVAITNIQYTILTN